MTNDTGARKSLSDYNGTKTHIQQFFKDRFGHKTHKMNISLLAEFRFCNPFVTIFPNTSARENLEPERL